jgi:hypothetical protein
MTPLATNPLRVVGSSKRAPDAGPDRPVAASVGCGRQGRAALSALESRINELEQLTTSQGRELRIQFERIAQLQADCDILRMRFSKT